MKLKNLFKTLGIALLIPTVSACSFLRTEESDALGIKEVTWVTDKDGNTVVTITYTDEEKEATVFTVPKGDAGDDGVSIEAITPTFDPDTGNTTIVVTYSDPTKEPEEFVIPSGKGIKEIHQEVDVDGNTVLTIEYTDGTFSTPYTIYKGATGKGIDEIVPASKPDGSIELTVKYSDGDEIKLTIPAPEKGNGVDHIEAYSDDENYYLTVYYTEGYSETVSFDRPANWSIVHEKPKDSEGRDGDYAFDIDHDVIYAKENGSWVAAVSFATEEATYEVKFDLNTPDAPYATRVSGYSSYNIKHGKTFYSYNYDLPLAVREGYTFSGWSTKPMHNPAVNGLFTDLTPVICDMTLYAVWTLN